MSQLLLTLQEQAGALSAVEVIAVLAAVGYLVLAIQQNIWCWAFAGVSTVIYVYLFVEARLYMESILNVFYFVMAIYGWYKWQSGRTSDQELQVSSWPIGTHISAVALILALSGVNGFLLQQFSDAAFPYIDSMTTWGAIWATFLVARKVLENWWYWLLIDVASIFIYWSRDLELTALLFLLYVLMIPFGLMSWRKSMRLQTA